MKNLNFSILCIIIVNLWNAQVLAVITRQVSSADTSEVFVETADEHTDTLLIKNANLIGRTDDLRVNLLIIGGKLTVVTKDDVWLGSSIPALDAENGFLMGKLVIGAAPSFIILSDNPRENFEVILNSAKYVIFAMNYGHII